MLEYFPLVKNWPHHDTAMTVFRYAILRELCRGKKVLEIGAASGEGTALFADVAQEVVAIDHQNIWNGSLSARMDNVRFVCQDALTMPDEWSGYFDVVVAMEFIEHIDDFKKFQDSVYKVLSKNGVLVVSTPNFDLYSDKGNASRKPLYAFHRHEYRAEELKPVFMRYWKSEKIVGLSQLAIPKVKPSSGTSEATMYFDKTIYNLVLGRVYPEYELLKGRNLSGALPLEFCQSLVAFLCKGVPVDTRKIFRNVEKAKMSPMSVSDAVFHSCHVILQRRNEQVGDLEGCLQHRDERIKNLEGKIQNLGTKIIPNGEKNPENLASPVADPSAQIGDSEQVLIELNKRLQACDAETNAARKQWQLAQQEIKTSREKLARIISLQGADAFRTAEGIRDARLANIIREQNLVDFSIILVNFNSKAYIEPCLERIRKQVFSGTKEIIVVNNLSTDGSLELLQEQADITLINPRRNLGYSKGNNVAIRRASGKYIFCLNFDCFLEPDFLQNVYNAFESAPEVGMISGKLYKMVDMQPTRYLDSTGIDFTTLIPADRGEWQYDKGQYDDKTHIFGPSGAAACYRWEALRKVVYNKTQFFDEQMFTYCEDIDLAWRLNLAGSLGLFLPDAVAFHERGATRKSSLLKKAGYYAIGFRNRLFTIAKNLRYDEDIKNRKKKLLRQEWRFLASWCGKHPARWGIAAYVLFGLAWLMVRPSFILKRRLAHRHKKGRGLNLSLDVDFWQESYSKRQAVPSRGANNSEDDTRIRIVKNVWHVSSQGFTGESWEKDAFFSGSFGSARGYLEIHIPEEYALIIKKLRLCLKIQTSSDITVDIEIISPEGKSARSDWQVVRSGNLSWEFDFAKMDLVPGSENLKIWQKPWCAFRIHLASGPGCAVKIHDMQVCGRLGEFSNERLNFSEISNLPMTLQSKPVLIYAEICTLCNMSCRMCGRAVHTIKSSEQGIMKREVFERLIEMFSAGSSLALFGRGETLMHPDFPYFLKLAKEKGMKVTFNSNGKALTEKIARVMVECGQDSITISCSAGSPETYKAIHRGGDWHRLWENIAVLQKLKKQFVSGRPSIYIEFVSQLDNIRELPGLIRRAMEYNLTGVIVIDMVAHTDELGKQRMNIAQNMPVADKYYKEALQVVDELRDKNPYFELRLPSSYNALTKKFSCGETESQIKALGEGQGKHADCFSGKHMCLEPWQTFYIRFDGKVAPCVITNRNLGDLNVQAAPEIWNGPDFRKFRSRMRSEDKPFECLRCHLFPGPQKYDKSLSNAEEYEPL